jgi:benzaldehyde dehydrogenase (NAD)
LPGGAEAGEALCLDPNVAMIAFTGSTAVGRRVGELAGRTLKKVSLELGGKNSLVILEDADVKLAVSNAAWGAWLHQGQICMATGRLIVHESLVEAVASELAAKAEKLRVGNPSGKPVALGPLISERQRDRVDAIVRDSVAAGARLRAGGTWDKLFYRPTVLDQVRPGMRAFEEEIFGPVAVITSFATDDEAVALANAGDHGLAAGVISNSLGRAMEVGSRLRAGMLHINDQTVADEPYIPFGGMGASGNGSRMGGPASIEEFTQWQWVNVKPVAPRYPF